MKVVVDTNIVFSGILNKDSIISKILLSYHPHFTFYSCNFLKSEIQKHTGKIQKLTKLNRSEIKELERLVTHNISFISEDLISNKHFLNAEDILKDIDLSDVPFLALTQQLKGILWTGDLKLVNGLKRKNFNKVVTTSQLYKLLNE